MGSFGSELWQLPPPFNMVVLIVLIVFGTSLITAIAGEVRKYATHREELRFKREMVNQGLTVEEIERVVQARQAKPGKPGKRA